jgi:hypothetical protein
MKRLHVLSFSLGISLIPWLTYAQLPNTLKFEYLTYQTYLNPTAASYFPEVTAKVQAELSARGAEGWELVEWHDEIAANFGNASKIYVLTMGQQPVATYLIFTFKRATSAREAELSQLMTEFRNNIDASGKKCIDEATNNVQTYMLGVLDESTKALLKDEAMKKITEGVLLTVRRSYDKLIGDIKSDVEKLKAKQ